MDDRRRPQRDESTTSTVTTSTWWSNLRLATVSQNRSNVGGTRPAFQGSVQTTRAISLVSNGTGRSTISATSPHRKPTRRTALLLPTCTGVRTVKKRYLVQRLNTEMYFCHRQKLVSSNSGPRTGGSPQVGRPRQLHSSSPDQRYGLGHPSTSKGGSPATVSPLTTSRLRCWSKAPTRCATILATPC